MIKLFKRNVFISHSSNNKEIAEQICAFLVRLGIDEDKVFCSSVIGQGINNGEKLNEAIAIAIQRSKLLIYLLSYDFINSSYCMEELGAGWYLEQTNKAKCFYFVMPDIELSDLHGFVNSKIHKFSFLSKEQQQDLSVFAENICKELRLKELRHSIQLNMENALFSSIQAKLEELVEQKRERINAEEEQRNQIASLRKEISEKEKHIEKQRLIIEEKSKETSKKEIQNELEIIEKRFMYLGFSEGLTKEAYKLLCKSFWFEMVNRYIELQELTGNNSSDDCMEMLLATIYAAENQMDKAYEHMKKYVELRKSQVYMSYFKNFLPFYSGSMREIIEILKEKAAEEKDGIVKDSYIETMRQLEEREATL